MSTIETILTHPGGAHKDEWLACSVLLALNPVPVVRRAPTIDELADPAVCVVDVGHEHDPDKNNYDHHQFPREHAPTCSLSLVLQSLNLYDDARQFCSWLETSEWLDSRGPFETAKWLGVDREILHQLNSPIDVTLLKRFAQESRLEPGDPLWEVMRMVGEDLLVYVRSLRERIEFIRSQAEFWEFDHPDGPLRMLFMPRTDPLPDEPSFGIGRFIEELSDNEDVVGMVYPDRRGSGYALARFRDDRRLDFTRVTDEPDVHFAHVQGFVAKTSSGDRERLRALAQAAL